MQRTRVKFCGITELDDALTAVSLGVDALGFVFYPASPRFISIEEATLITRSLPPFVCKVGLFVDADEKQVVEYAKHAELDLIQYHGDESIEYCMKVAHPFIKAIKMKADLDIAEACAQYVGAKAILLDSYDANMAGGTGVSFDWGRIPQHLSKPIILAGGLRASNVATAISQVHPYAVDVSGGIERSKGIKDPAKMAAFMHEVRTIERKP